MCQEKVFFVKLEKFDERSVKVKDQQPTFLDKILMSLIQGSLTPEGRQNVEDVLNENDSNYDPYIPDPTVPIRDFKGRTYKSLDDFIMKDKK